MSDRDKGRRDRRDPQSLTAGANNQEPWNLVIGQVVAPFGVQGEVRVRPETDFPGRFPGLTRVRLELPTGEERELDVRRARVTPKGVLLLLEGCETRDQATALRGAWVKIRESAAAQLGDGQYYVHQILGLHAYTEEGRDLGEIIEVIHGPANDVYATETTMIPALREVVKEVELERGRMVVSLPPGAEDT
jgi:16S rRNA processing protein RimM